MGYNVHIVKSIANNDYESVKYLLSKISDDDIREVVKWYVDGTVKGLDQIAFVIVCVLTNKVDLLIELYNDLTGKGGKSGQNHTVAIRISRVFINLSIYNFFIYERPDMLKKMLRLQIAISGTVPVISESIIDKMELDALPLDRRVVVAEYLKEYYEHYNKGTVEFPTGFNSAEAYGETLFKCLMDLKEFADIIDIKTDIEVLKYESILFGLNLLGKYKREEPFHQKMNGNVQYSEKEEEEQKRRKERISDVMKRLSVSGKVAGIVFKGNIEDFMGDFDFPELMKKFPEDFI